MATLRNKRKLAAVSRETPENTRSGRAPNVLDPELTQEYISQVSEEIEGRVTKKLSKEFSRTESRILGALSKLDEFLLNPQVRTCSVAAPGTSRSSNLENQGTNEDRPSDDPGPEVEFSSPISGAETDPHTNLLFLDVPETATEQVRTCGFRRNSSSLAKAPKMRDFVRLNSFEGFFVASLQSLQKPG